MCNMICDILEPLMGTMGLITVRPSHALLHLKLVRNLKGKPEAPLMQQDMQSPWNTHAWPQIS